MKKLALLTLAVAVVTVTAQAQAPTPPDTKTRTVRVEKRNGQEPRVFQFQSNGMGIPNLSQEQKDQMKQLRIAAMKEQTDIRNQMAEKRAHLNTLQSSDKSDMSAINKTIDEIASLQAQQMKIQAACHVKTRALLTDEQKVAFDSRKNLNFNFDFNRSFDFSKDGKQVKARMIKLGDNVMNFDGFEGFNSLSELGDMSNMVDVDAILNNIQIPDIDLEE